MNDSLEQYMERIIAMHKEAYEAIKKISIDDLSEQLCSNFDKDMVSPDEDGKNSILVLYDSESKTFKSAAITMANHEAHDESCVIVGINKQDDDEEFAVETLDKIIKAKGIDIFVDQVFSRLVASKIENQFIEFFNQTHSALKEKEIKSPAQLLLEADFSVYEELKRTFIAGYVLGIGNGVSS